jgi:peptidoglycan/xylan/chitin deacetylase (PgdA/CDA1 family)
MLKLKAKEWILKLFFSIPFNNRMFFNVHDICFITYHSISQPSSAFPEILELNVKPSIFEDHMKYLSRYYNPISMSYAEQILSGDAKPIKNAVVVSFDDGYKDNLSNALPILKKYNIPATIFLTSGLINTDRRLWLIELYLDIFRTKVNLVEVETSNGAVKIVIPLDGINDKYNAMLRLRDYLKNIKSEVREKTLENLHFQLRQNHSNYDTDHLTMLSWQDVLKLKKEGISFGSHTVNHLSLESETEDSVNWEAKESKRIIEDRIQSEITAFAYPGNAGKGFTENTKNIIQKAGYKSSYLFSTGKSFNKVGCDLFELNRGEVLGSTPELAGEISVLLPVMRTFLYYIRTLLYIFSGKPK